MTSIVEVYRRWPMTQAEYDAKSRRITEWAETQFYLNCSPRVLPEKLIPHTVK